MILSVAHPDTFMLEGAERQPDGLYMVKNDPYGLRNGDLFKIFHDKDEIRQYFSRDFEDICIGMTNDDYYGMHIQLWLIVMRKK